MKKVLSIFALLMAASMLFWLAGCGGDDDDDECADIPAPSVASVVPASGAIASNTTVTVTFSKVVTSATIAINGTAVAATSTDNKVFTFQPNQEGALSLTIEATDDCDQGLDPPFAGASYTAAAPDTVAPSIDDAACDPKNNADGVDPTGYETITITFDEPMGSAEVVSIEPAIDPAPTQALSADKTALVISFLGGYKLSNEMEVAIELSGVDLAGNALATTSYEFTTMAKE